MMSKAVCFHSGCDKENNKENNKKNNKKNGELWE